MSNNFNMFALDDGSDFTRQNLILLDKAVELAISKADWSMLKGLLADPLFCYDYQRESDTVLFSNEALLRLLRLMEHEAVMSADESAFLLSPILYNWEILSEGQMQSVLTTLQGVWPKIKDWAAQFKMSEIIGEAANEQALKLILMLRESDDEKVRLFMPHSLENLIKNTQSEKLAKEAYTILTEMVNDESHQVKDEAVSSLRKVLLHSNNDVTH